MLAQLFETAEAVTPSNSVDFAGGIAGALYVGGAGNVVLITRGGQAITFTSVAAGTVIPVACRRVNSTSTTATNMVALFGPRV